MKIAFTVYNLAFISNWIKKMTPYMKDCTFTIFHIASLQGKKLPEIEGVRCYDVSSLSHTEIDGIITQVKPDLWISFNFRSLFELFFQRICVQHGIRQVYLEHGIFSQNTLHFKTGKAKKNIGSTIHRQYVFWKKYISFLLHCKHFVKELQVLQQVYFNGKFSASPFDHYFIYSQREYDLLAKVFPLNRKNTSLVGYPIFNGEKEKANVSKQRDIDGDVLYIHQPFILDGFASIDYEQEKTYLLSIKNIISKRYNNLVILLHPRESLSKYIERFQNTGIKIIQSPNDYSCYINKSLILGHYSTALFYALYFEKPTAILKYPTVQNDLIFKECFELVMNLDELKTKDFKINIAKKEYMLGEVNTYEHIADEIMTQGKL